MGKKIISFSLYGNESVYYDGCIQNAMSVYDGWVCRFYVSQHVPESFVDRLKKLGAEVIRKESKGAHDGSLWRFLPVSEPDVDVMISRDADARLGDRDLFVINEWLGSSKDVHIIRDHPSHAMPILAGLWGYRGTFPLFAKLIDEWTGIEFGTDQWFLSTVYNMIDKNDIFIHSDYIKYPGETVHPIRMLRDGDVWLGMPHGRGEERVAIFQTKKHLPLLETTNGLV
jgi:hypothetical protein